MNERLLGDERNGDGMAVCDKGKYLFIGENDGWKSTYVRVFGINQDIVTELASLNIQDLNVTNFSCFTFVSYFGSNSLIFSTSPSGNKTSLVSFRYDIEEGKIEELEGERKEVEMGRSLQLVEKETRVLAAVSIDNFMVEFKFIFNYDS